MLRPHELCKWLKKTNRSDLLSLNPQSPTLPQKECKDRQSMNEMMLMRRCEGEADQIRVARDLAKRSKNTRRVIYTLKESPGHKLDGRIASSKYFDKKINSKRVNTVPSKIQYASEGSSRRSQDKPAVLIISELKLHSSVITAEREARAQRLDSIQVRIETPPGKIKFDQIKLSARQEKIKEIFSATQRLDAVMAIPTAHYPLRVQSPVRNKSVYQDKSRIVAKRRKQTITIKGKEEKIIALIYNKPYNPPNNVTAKSFLVYRIASKDMLPRVVLSHNSKNRQQIASLTKIMTAILTIEICKMASIDKYAEVLTITSFEAGIAGTTASLRQGEVYTIDQLLYGLMLPSGNDASVALAAWAGLKLLQHAPDSKLLKTNSFKSAVQRQQTLLQRRQRGYTRFIEEMNSKARQLKMKKTVYMNSHGLSNPQSKSCAYDIAILCEYCMQNETFRNIVKSPKYSGYIQARRDYPKDEESSEHFSKSEIVWKKNSMPEKKTRFDMPKKLRVQWHNTHELIRKHPEDYLGIKTGFTYTAGPCLASCVRIDGLEYIIVVLGCETASMRFRDTETLRKWTRGQLEEERSRLQELQKGKRRSILKVECRVAKR